MTVSADDSGTDQVNVTIPIACTLSGTGNSSHTATVSPNTYEDDIGTTTLKAICNDANGFAIYATGYTGNVVGDTNSTKLIGTNTNQLISTGIGTSGDSQWAMKLATDSTATYPITIESAPNTSGGTDASFADYHIVPTDYTKVATRLAATDAGTSATGSILTTTYAVNIASTQAADTYIGKVIYTLVHPNDAAAPVIPLKETDCPANTICYAPNSYDIVGSMDSIGETKITKSPTAGVQSTSSNATPTLIAPNYSRENYGFAGWSTEFDAANATDPVIFGPNQTITTSTTAGAGDADVSQHGLILYPVWVESAGIMQSDASTVCSNLTAASYNTDTGTLSASLSSISALTDERDGNTYAIAKLADENCWMIENLRINADDTLGDTNKALAQGYGTSTTYGNFTGLASSENANFISTNPPVANTLYSTDGSTTNTIQGGDSSYYYARMPRYNNNNTNRSLTPSYSGTGSTTYYQWYGYGNYYTWAAAIASIKQYTGPTSTDDEDKTSETAGTSLCPTGWQLPYGRNTGNGIVTKGFSYLNNQMLKPGANQSTSTNAIQSKKWRSFPNNFVYSGVFNTASANNRSTLGLYWSSTAYNDTKSYTLHLTSSGISPGWNNSNKYESYSIRCLTSS